MESCLSVDRELDKVLAKFSGLQEHTQQTLDELITSLENIRAELVEGLESNAISATQSLIFSQCLRKCRDVVSKISSEHRDLHSSVSKVGKAIDRNFVNDFSAVLVDGAFEGEEKQKLLNEVICEHFLRQGMLDIAESLDEEANLHLDADRKEPFLELHRILGALKRRELGPALSWAAANRDKLIAQNSSLEFKLHRLHFIDLLKQGEYRQLEALQYAKNFVPLTGQNTKELQVLMGSLLYLKQGIETSPYAFLLDPIYWAEICDVFTRDACSLMGLSVESPLSVGVRAGCIALPPLLNIKQVMQQRQVSGVWCNKDELPVEIDLGKEYRYHSVFACPILRQQSNDTNPPVRLICGHAISKDALNKLATANKVKCPYCPVEQVPADARQIHF